MGLNYTLILDPDTGGPPCHVECQEDVAVMVTGEVIYPHREDLWHLKFWQCPTCEAYVGAHRNGFPKGYPAGPETRQARMEAHRAFDTLWKRGPFTRDRAYLWLGETLNIPKGECHIAMMDADTAKKVEEVSMKMWTRLKERKR